MFGFGFWEFAIIVAVALVVLGPAMVPRLGRRVGDLVIGFRKAGDELERGLREELDAPGPADANQSRDLTSVGHLPHV